MPILALDLGGTKLSSALFSESGSLLQEQSTLLSGRTGDEVGDLIVNTIQTLRSRHAEFDVIGVSVPGIANQNTGKVWAPNIPGWDDYPLRQKLLEATGMSVMIDNDRACSILGECWQGNSKECCDAIFLAVGTGIGAGIITSGNILRGAHDIAGAIGWMALDRPFQSKYIPVGCFEYYASGDGMARLAREVLANHKNYNGVLLNVKSDSLSAHSILTAFSDGDELAAKIVKECITYWGMAAANLVSLFNPEKIIFGGGMFGPAVKFIPQIKDEARLWAQPIAINQVSFEPSALGTDAALYGAARLAFQNLSNKPRE